MPGRYSTRLSYRGRGRGKYAAAAATIQAAYRGRIRRSIYKKSVARVYPRRASAPLKKFVDKRIESHNPDHWVRTSYAWTGLQGIPHQQASGAPSGIFPIIPKIAQVTQIGPGGQLQTATISSREGNQITLKNIIINLNLVMSPTYAEQLPSNAGIRYRVIVFSSKKYSQYNDTMNNYWDTAGSDNMQMNFLRDGADSKEWNEKMEDFDLPVNTEYFTVHAQRTGKMNRGVAIGDSTGSTTNMPMPNVTLKIPLKVKNKKLLYRDPVSNLPSNFNPMLWIGYKAYDGTFLHSGNYFHMVGNSVVQFEDY